MAKSYRKSDYLNSDNFTRWVVTLRHGPLVDSVSKLAEDISKYGYVEPQRITSPSVIITLMGPRPINSGFIDTIANFPYVRDICCGNKKIAHPPTRDSVMHPEDVRRFMTQQSLEL